MTTAVEPIPFARRITASAPPPLPTSTRLQSLDAYRGFIMLALMASPFLTPLGKATHWNWLITNTEHVQWEGCGFWDLIQPSFMFMVGVAMPFAFARRQQLGHSWNRQLVHALVRAINLILLGWVLDNFGDDSPATHTLKLGFIRVLQQISFGYVAAFFLLGRAIWIQGLVAGSILVLYNILWTHNHWNGPGGPWAMGNQNIGSAFDYWTMKRNYSGLYVGMNAIPSTATIIFGVMAGQFLKQRRSALVTIPVLLLAGAAGIAAGWAASQYLHFPIIKKIWTPSFTLFAGGITTLMLLAFYIVIDAIGLRKWSLPLVVVGMNSIAAYVIAQIFKPFFRQLSQLWIGSFWLHVLHLELKNPWYPVVSGFAFVLFGWGLLFWCYRRKVFFKL